MKKNKMINIAHLNSFDQIGGAAKAAFLIHKSLNKHIFNSKFFVSKKLSNDNSVFEVRMKNKYKFLPKKYKVENLIMKLFGKKKGEEFFTSMFEYFDFQSNEVLLKSDIISLYWVADSFISAKQIYSFNKPIVWRLSDVSPFTGGCHYPSDCIKYVNGCENCPRVNSNAIFDLVEYTFLKKKKYIDNLNLTVVAPSRWIYKLAKKSDLFKSKRIEYIATGVDTNLYFPKNKNHLRKKYGLNLSKKYILFGATSMNEDKRKGIELLLKSLEYYKNENFELILFGKGRIDVNIPSINLGYIKEDKIKSEIFSLADAFIAPSIEENLANTVLESMSCGTPVVAFNIGGMPDVIDHKINGYLAKPFDLKDLWSGILYILNADDNDIRQKAREKIIKDFNIKTQTQKFEELFFSIV